MHGEHSQMLPLYKWPGLGIMCNVYCTMHCTLRYTALHCTALLCTALYTAHYTANSTTSTMPCTPFTFLLLPKTHFQIESEGLVQGRGG